MDKMELSELKNLASKRERKSELSPVTKADLAHAILEILSGKADFGEREADA